VVRDYTDLRKIGFARPVLENKHKLLGFTCLSVCSSPVALKQNAECNTTGELKLLLMKISHFFTGRLSLNRYD